MRYLDICLTHEAARKVPREVFGRLVFQVHGLIKTHQHPVAVAWPQVTLGELGTRLRLFVTEACPDAESAIMDMLKRWPVALITHQGAFQDAPASRVTVRYQRNRSFEKRMPKTIASRDQYRIRHGKPPVAEFTRPPTELEQLQARSRIDMQSSTNGHGFSLFITHEFMPEPDSKPLNGQSYGLGHVLPHF